MQDGCLIASPKRLHDPRLRCLLWVGLINTFPIQAPDLVSRSCGTLRLGRPPWHERLVNTLFVPIRSELWLLVPFCIVSSTGRAFSKSTVQFYGFRRDARGAEGEARTPTRFPAKHAAKISRVGVGEFVFFFEAFEEDELSTTSSSEGSTELSLETRRCASEEEVVAQMGEAPGKSFPWWFPWTPT